MPKITTPWGPATLVEELSLPQEADGREFASHVQLLECADGEQRVRFAYTRTARCAAAP